MRLEGPRSVVLRVVAGTFEVGAFFKRPARVKSIVLLDALIEFARDAADGLLVADIGGAQPAGGEAAEVLAWLDEDDRLAHACRLNGRADAAGGAAVDD